MKALPIILLCVLLTAALPGFAQEKTGRKTTPKNAEKSAEAAPAEEAAPAGDEPAQIAGAFFGLLEKSKVEEAYTNLTKGSKIAERPEELKALKSKTTEAIQMFGIIQGYDLIETKSVGAHLIRRTYLSLGKEFPLRWRFYFYLSMGRWRLVDLRVDDRLTGTFEEPEEPKADLSVPK